MAGRAATSRASPPATPAMPHMDLSGRCRRALGGCAAWRASPASARMGVAVRRRNFGAPHPRVLAGRLRSVARAQGVSVERWDVVLIRTGLLRYWPDPQQLADHRGAGPDLSAARWLVETGVVATGSDTETYEVQPAPDRGTPANPQPVHTLLLIEHGVYLMESLDLEGLAAAGVREFLFVALPLAIRGATGSMIDPVAIT